MLGKLRPKVSRLPLLLAKPFALLGIHPNIVSLLGIPLACVSAYFILQQSYFPAFLFALLAVSTDLIDGSVATLLKKRSNFGNYFETMVDKCVEIILIAPFALSFPLAAFCAVSLSLLASYAKPRVALVIITDNRDWPAVGEHAERLLLLLAGLLASAFGFAVYGFSAMELSLWLIAIISFAGLLQRMLFARKLILEAEKNGNVLPYLKKKN